MKVYLKSRVLGNDEIPNVMLFWYEEREDTYHIRYKVRQEDGYPIVCEKIYPKWDVDSVKLEDTTHPAK